MKLIAQYLLGLIGSFIFFFFGLFIGAMIGGNTGFMEFAGLSGYEAGGMFFGTLGISIGAYLGIFSINRKMNHKLASLALVIITLLNLVLLEYELLNDFMFITILLPTTALFISGHWKRARKH